MYNNTIILIPDENILILENAFKIFKKVIPYINNPYYEYENQKDVIINRFIFIPCSNEKNFNLINNLCLKSKIEPEYIFIYKTENIYNNFILNNLYHTKKIIEYKFPSRFYPVPNIIICSTNNILNLIEMIFPFEAKFGCITFETE